MSEHPHSAAARYCELILRHERRLRWLCLRRAHGDPDLADDFFQEVALTLWRHLPKLEDDISPRRERAYVKRAARYVLGHCNRGRHPDFQRLGSQLAIALDQEGQEKEELLNDLTRALPAADALLVGLYRSGYSAADIARFLGIKPNTASQRLHRAILKMRAIYEKECETINRMSHEH